MEVRRARDLELHNLFGIVTGEGVLVPPACAHRPRQAARLCGARTCCAACVWWQPTSPDLFQVEFECALPLLSDCVRERLFCVYLCGWLYVRQYVQESCQRERDI